jgi:alanyl-tRNA synthetase
MQSQDLRSSFLRFFESHGHTVKPSASLIPDDPGLLFTVAGMVPFKPVFLGQVKSDLKRAASSQKCIRTNDIDNVGRTRRHHTFFEMLGNFSFGDYFKEGAIAYAWEFLTDPKWMGLPKDKLWVSIFEEDDEAGKIWLKYVPQDRIIKMGAKDNFWAAGPTGPCGPCSEIYYDFGPAADPGVREGDVENGGDRYIEIWNNVFMQYDRDEAGKLTPLPKQNIDTGMGLERLAAVKQGKLSNFETDLFKPIIDAAAHLTGIAYGQDAKKDLSLKVIADHLRGACFLIADGVLPGNEGRGYVLRRILRRAVRHGRLLGITQTFLPAIFPAIEGIFGGVYPELGKRREAILTALKDEEERFSRTLDTGTELLEDLMKKSATKALDGAEVFKLYDTFGFPLELTQEMAAEQGYKVDEAGFKAQMEAQRQRARAARADGGHGDSPVYGDLAKQHGKTAFRGYDAIKVEGAKVVALLKDGKPVAELKAGEEGEAFLDQTPFYGESGGQVGDQGELLGGGLLVIVDETRKRAGGDLHSHFVRVSEGSLKPGSLVTAVVDAEARLHIARHHSATHVLHAALRKVLGEHVHQAGSYCGPDRLRFDFHHSKALTPDERRAVEDQVNAWLLSNAAAQTRVLGVDEAKKEGAMALFGEKYGDSVRVVSFGDWSKELCGGTHVQATGQVGAFRILSEASVSSGVRRIEAVAGAQALQVWRESEAFVEGVASALKSTVADLPVRVGKLLEREKELQKKLEKAMAGGGGGLTGETAEVGALKLFFGYLEEAELEQLKQLADQKRDELGAQALVALAAGAQVEGEWKAVVVATASKGAAKAAPAGGFIKDFTAKFGGRGGGKPEFAQGGGGDFARFKAFASDGIAHLKAFAEKGGQ